MLCDLIGRCLLILFTFHCITRINMCAKLNPPFDLACLVLWSALKNMQMDWLFDENRGSSVLELFFQNISWRGKYLSWWILFIFNKIKIYQKCSFGKFTLFYFSILVKKVHSISAPFYWNSPWRCNHRSNGGYTMPSGATLDVG